MACRNWPRRSDLQNVLAVTADRLTALSGSDVARKIFLDEDDPDDLALLAALTLDVAGALDPIFHEIAYQGALGSRSSASAYAAVVTTALAGNLDFELRDRADRIADRRCAPDPDDEHRLSGAELGLGRHR